MTSNWGALKELCEPEQLCFPPGCGAKIAHIVSMMIEKHHDWPNKTRVYLESVERPVEAPADMRQAGAETTCYRSHQLVFQEALSSHPCMPSPAIRERAWVGKRMCRECGVIDQWGDAVMCCKHICGQTYGRRHHMVAQYIVSKAALSRIPLDCEVYGKLTGSGQKTMLY